MITIEQLAEKLEKTVWEKGNLKRIYLDDAGWNTKKMSTKTFIYQNEDGEFCVSCRIECPSQPLPWIKSQEEEVKESVLRDIEEAIAEIGKNIVSTDQELAECYNIPEKTEPELEKEEIFLSDGIKISAVNGVLYLWFYKENTFYKNMDWMPIVNLCENQQENHTHRLDKYYFELKVGEDKKSYSFEGWINKHISIECIKPLHDGI